MYDVTYTMQPDGPTNILACGTRMELAIHHTIFPCVAKNGLHGNETIAEA